MSGLDVDPFGERVRPRLYRRFIIMGAMVRFETESPRLLRLVDDAFAGLPSHRFGRSPPGLTIRLALARRSARTPRAAFPPVRLTAGAGILAGVVDADNFAILSPRERRALVQISPAALRCARLVRYELVEFATLALITRALGLVALHAGCVGSGGRGVLLLGDSGAGKSTLTLQASMDGLEFLAEDSVFASPDTMRLTAVPAYLHVQRDSLRFLGDRALRRRIDTSPVIVRRSGARKFELDLRRAGIRVARRPLLLSAVVILSTRPAADDRLLASVSRAGLLRALENSQPQARDRPEWPEFRRRVARLPAFVLSRGSHPRVAIAALRQVLRRLGSAP